MPGARRLGSAQQHSGAVWALAASRGDGSLLASGELWRSTGAEVYGASFNVSGVQLPGPSCPGAGWAHDGGGVCVKCPTACILGRCGMMNVQQIALRAPAGGADATVRYWSLQDSSPAAEAGRGKSDPAADVQPPRSVPGLLKTFQTKATPVFALHFTQRNLLLGTGALTLPPLRRKPLTQ